MSAMIFDMDGVLVDTEPLKFVAYEKVFQEQFGVAIAEYPARLGLAEPAVMGLYLRKHGLEADIPKLIQLKREAYYKILESDEVRMFSGVKELFDRLREAGFAIGLTTSSDRKSTDIILTRFGLRDYFAAILTQEDVTRKKPDPEIYLKSAERLGLLPSACIAVEDSPAGVEAAKRAGMKCVAVTNSVNRDELGKADLVIESLSELSMKKINFIFYGGHNAHISKNQENV